MNGGQKRERNGDQGDVERSDVRERSLINALIGPSDSRSGDVDPPCPCATACRLWNPPVTEPPLPLTPLQCSADGAPAISRIQGVVRYVQRQPVQIDIAPSFFPQKERASAEPLSSRFAVAFVWLLGKLGNEIISKMQVFSRLQPQTWNLFQLRAHAADAPSGQ